MLILNKKEEILNEVRNRIVDLMLDNDVDVKVKRQDYNEYVDFEVGVGSGLRKALSVVHEVMNEYGIKIRN